MERHYQQGPSFPFPIPPALPLPPNYPALPFPVPQSQYSTLPNFQLPSARNLVPRMGAVPGYDLITYRGSLCRVASWNLPLHVFTPDPRLASVLHDAADVWNDAAHTFQGQDVLRVDSQPSHRAIEVTFDTSDMPNRAVGATTMTKSSSGVQVTGISIRPMRSTRDTITQVLAHELGHSLGMDHSQNPDDLMYKAVHHGSDASLSQRDYDQFRWLYTQNEALPIVAAW